MFKSKYFFFVLLYTISLFYSCKEETVSPSDQYYLDLDKFNCPLDLEQPVHNRLGRKSDLYSLFNICPKSENNYYFNNYRSLLDNVNLDSITLPQLEANLIPLDWVDSTFLQEVNFSVYSASDSIAVFPVSRSQLFSFSSLSITEQYLTLRHLITNCDKFRSLAKSLEEDITIDLTLYLFDKNELQDIFPGLYIELLQLKGSGFLAENEVDNIRYGNLAEIFLQKELNHIHKHDLKTQHDIATANLSSAILKQGDTLKAIRTLISTPIIKDSAYIYQNLALNYLDVDSNDIAINYLSKILEINGKYDQYLHQDFARSYAQKGDFIKAQFHIENAKDVSGLSFSDSLSYLFHLSELEAIVSNLEFQFTCKPIKLHDSFNSYKERRNIGAIEFENDLSHHASEFYAFNTGNLLKILYQIQNEESNVSNDIWQYIKKCILESKQKDELIDYNGYSRKTRDHTKIADYLNDVFLNQYIDFFENYNTNNQTIDETLVIEAKEQQFLNRNYSTLHFLKGRYHYWCLYENNITTKLHRIDINQFEKELETNYDLLKSNSLQSLPLLSIWTELDLALSDTIILYSDGLLNEYPHPIKHNQVLYAEHYNSNTVILNTDLSILSYTSPRTNGEFIELKQNELIGGYNESLGISQLITTPRFFSGYDCTYKNFVTSMSSDILHIATHAYSDNIHRLESYLILRDSLGQPMRLYADEILTMPTVPKFVNLSACQTGTGVHMAGAGTYSIARSFLQKGSEAVMKTLWDVDDQATKEFMITFYTKWNEGKSCGDALRETKQVFKSSENYSAPYYWAGFILEGNPNLYISKN